MITKYRRRFIWSAAIGFLFWVTAAYLFHFELPTKIDEAEVEKFQQSYLEKTKELDEDLMEFLTMISAQESQERKFEIAQQLSETSEFEFFVYSNDSLVIWTSNAVPLVKNLDKKIIQRDVILLLNGWYHFEYLVSGNDFYIGSLLIKRQYPHENEDLTNSFNPLMIDKFQADINVSGYGHPIENEYGKTVFYVSPSDEIEKNEVLEIVIFFLYLIAFIVLIQLLINAFQKVFLRRPLLLVFFPLLLVAVRYFWLKLGWLGPMRDFTLFNPELFASTEFVPSLGDLIINVVIFYLLVHFLLKRTRNWFSEGNRRLKMALFIIPLFIISFVIALEINNIFKVLIFDSQIPFDISHLFDLNVYSFISITIIGSSFYAYFKLVQYIIIQIRKNKFEWNKLAFLWALTSAAYVLVDQVYFENNILTSLWPIFLSGSLLWFLFKEKETKFVHIISMVALMSFYSAYIMHSYMEEKERNIRVTYAEDKIAIDNDINVELDYLDIEKDLKKDSSLITNFYNEFNHADFSEDLETSHFKKLKQEFDLTFYLFASDSESVVDYRNYETKEYSRTLEIIKESGKPSEIEGNENIYFIPDYTDKLSYLANFPIYFKDSLYGFLVTEIRSKKFPDDIGLPSLLLDEGVGGVSQQENYSFAKYINGKLVNSRGNFTYPVILADWQKQNRTFVDRDDYNHYVYHPDEGHVVVVSYELLAPSEIFTDFSYLLIIFGVLLLIPLGYDQIRKGVSFRNIKLNIRIQVVLIGLTIVTLIAFAFGAEEFVVGQYYENNIDLIKEKIESVRIEIEDKLENERKLDPGLSGYLDYVLKKFSDVFAAEINIYDLNGDLQGTSQPKIYTKGLISRKMNTASFIEMNINERSEYIHQEQIGNLYYLSAYSPFFNKYGEKMAYLNVQYLSKQDELENQISSLLLAIMNIMVLMLAISTILAVTISNRLTRPLKYIQESLKGMQLGARYKPIDYQGSDEIGELVKEYNKKVKELQENAEALAKSERESAWREMAKQVAHEIKNPLTPMKLSIQHLKRTIKPMDEESNEKLNHVTTSLIEQIDALTQIANEFSNFAKMPKAEESELDLAQLLRSASAVYTESDGHEVLLKIPKGMEAIIWADKDLLLRVFNNLIKNAIQAIPSGDEGKIEIDLIEIDGSYIVSIKDNGKGIKEEEKDKIFVPYFTTKSKGTGLGLAMTKQIVEGMKGKIWFETELDKGTTFYVSFPQFK